MGEWGIEEAKKYSWRKIASQVLNFYQLCLESKKRREEKEGFSLEKEVNKIFKEIF